jgi:hypothetical protein
MFTKMWFEHTSRSGTVYAPALKLFYGLKSYIRFEILTAVNVTTVIFWDVIPCSLVQWNLDSSFSTGSWINRWIWENDRCEGLYKMNKNCHICLYVFTKSKKLQQWYYVHCQVQFVLLVFKKSLIHICLVEPFFFKLNNNHLILTFDFSVMMMSWPYMNALIDSNNTKANTTQWHEALYVVEHTWWTVHSTMQKAWIDSR